MDDSHLELVAGMAADHLVVHWPGLEREKVIAMLRPFIEMAANHGKAVMAMKAADDFASLVR